MFNTPHMLRDEFPDQMEAIHALNLTSPEFARVLEEYDEVNDRIHRAETREGVACHEGSACSAFTDSGR
jgi:uncharacterized protein